MFITEMPRPWCRRRIGFVPGVTYFKPVGVPMRALEEVVLTLDELEALRLADFNGLYQEQAAEKMNVSRATFARIIESARKKVADALLHGKALRVEGGPVLMDQGLIMNAAQRKGEHGLGRGPCGGGMRRGCCGGAGQGNTTGWCVCSKCGQQTPHVPGEPCNQKICPKCGSRMIGESRKTK